MATENAPALDSDVIILGGGPVGLAVAVDLAWHGQKPILIERGDGEVVHPRAGGFTARTMEHLRRWGIADEARKYFNPDFPLNQRFCLSVSGKELATARLGTLRETQTPPETPEKHQRCRQMYYDPIIRKRAIELGADLRMRHEVEGFADKGDHVEVAVRNLETGESLVLRTAWLVACDGGRSWVRDQLGIDVTGNRLNHSLSVLLEGDIVSHGGEAAERYIILGPEGPWANITTMEGENRQWRMNLRYKEEPDLATFDAQEVIRRAVSPDADLKVLSILPWRRSNIIADHFQSGRVLMAGDAVHVMTPTGGFGANTGIGDAVDLGWKLRAVIEGWGGDALIDSYEIERRPIAFRNVFEAERNHHAWSPTADTSRLAEEGEEGDRIRRQIGEALVEASYPEWNSIGVALGYAYLNSPLCVPDGTPPPIDEPSVYRPTARPGHRAPHAWLADGRSTLDLFGKAFVLLSFGNADPKGVEALAAAAAERGVPFQVERIDASDIAAAYEQPLVLVRPDGHVAWRGAELPDAGGLIDIVRGKTVTPQLRALVENATYHAQARVAVRSDIAA